MMLLSLVIVAVEITSFTVACFSLSWLYCVFFSSIKKSQQNKQKNKQTLDKEGDKISLCPPPYHPPPQLLIVPGVVLPHSPPPTISHQTHRSGGPGVFVVL